MTREALQPTRRSIKTLILLARFSITAVIRTLLCLFSACRANTLHNSYWSAQVNISYCFIVLPLRSDQHLDCWLSQTHPRWLDQKSTWRTIRCRLAGRILIGTDCGASAVGLMVLHWQNLYLASRFNQVIQPSVIPCRFTLKSMDLEVKLELSPAQVQNQVDTPQRASPRGWTPWWEGSSGIFSERSTGPIRWHTRSRRNWARSRWGWMRKLDCVFSH